MGVWESAPAPRSARSEQASPRLPRVVVATNMYPTDSDPARGAFVKVQVEALRSIGIPIEVFCIRGDQGASNYVRAVGALRQLTATFSADLIYAFYGLTGWVALWQPKPLVLSLAGDDVLGTPTVRGGITMKSRLGSWLTQWAASRASVVCVQSEEMKERLWGHELRRRAIVVPYGVDPGRFHPGDQARARYRLGLDPRRPLVIFPNTPSEPRKRLDLALGAMAIVKQDIPDVDFLVVTKVSHDKMPDYYRSADCCLLASDWEGSPNVVKEALFSGLPVVTTDVGDVRHWIPLSPESVICNRTSEELARGVTMVLRARRRVDPQAFVPLISSQAIALRMLSLFREVAHVTA